VYDQQSALEAAKKEHVKLGRDAERFLEYIAKLREANKKAEKNNELLKQNIEIMGRLSCDSLFFF
jgi:predicted transcriptional regulator